MQYNRLGNTGLLVSRMALGTNTFGGKDSPVWSKIGGLELPAVEAVIGSALDSGVNLLDAADVYANGESEDLIGQALGNLATDRSDLVIATKAGGRMAPGINKFGSSRGYLMYAVEASLRRLRTDYIDLFMIHYFDPATPIEETMRTLDGLVTSGKVRYLGCSNFAAWQVMKANGVAAREGLERLEVIQMNWSAATRGIEREIVPMVEDQKMGIMVWGPLLSGLLAGRMQASDFDMEQVPLPIGRQMLTQVARVIADVAQEIDATPAQVSLAWLLCKSSVCSVLFGALNPDHVQENVRAAELSLSQEHVQRIDAAGELTQEYGQWIVRTSSSARNEYV